MAAVTICSDSGAPQNKICTVSIENSIENISEGNMINMAETPCTSSQHYPEFYDCCLAFKFHYIIYS